MENNNQYISQEKKIELEAELADLKGPKRQVILEALQYARGLGDLSENAEYHNAREEQARLEERINQIEIILRDSMLVTTHNKAEISVGSVVTILKKGSKEKNEYTLVGSEEANIHENKISNNSPLGAAIIGRKKGDKVTVTTPKGVVEYEIIDTK
jgi:transcription elongation factor GreA